jgi:hypothetical protein
VASGCDLRFDALTGQREVERGEDMLSSSVDGWSDSTGYVIIACVILLVAVAAFYLAVGRKQQQVDPGRPWREVLEGLPVALVGKYFHMRTRAGSREFMATLMSLENEGLLVVEGSQAIIEKEAVEGLAEPVSAEALKLFEILVDADGVMLLSSLCDKVGDRRIKGRLDAAYPRWKDVVDRVAKDSEPAVSHKGRMKLILRYLGYALILLALVTFSILGLVAATAFLITGLAVLGIGSIIREDLSPIENAAKELYEWLEDSKSGEPLPRDVDGVNRLLIYARAFGIEKETFERLKAEAPQPAGDSRLISLDFWARFEADAFNQGGRNN